MAREPVSTVVAHAKVVDRPEVRSSADQVVQVRAGQPLELRFAYDFEEASRLKEHYKFTLESRIGSQREQPASAQWGDAWGVPDSRQGYLHQRYLLRSAGEYEAEYRARVAYRREPWSGGEAEVMEEEANGVFRVQVV